MSTHLDSVRWVRSDRIHLTPKFLGDVEEERLASVSDAIDQVTGGLAPLPFAFGAVGAFPRLARARVVWVGLSGALSRLNKL